MTKIEWTEVATAKPLEDNVHGTRQVLTCWPLHAIDDEGAMTDKIVGWRQAVVEYRAVGNGGAFEDAPYADACGEWFGDDYCYAEQPSHWSPLQLNPDGTDTSTDITHIDGQPIGKPIGEVAK